MEPLVIDWAKEESKMSKIVRNNHLTANISILSRLCPNLFSQVNSTEGVLPNDEF